MINNSILSYNYLELSLYFLKGKLFQKIMSDKRRLVKTINSLRLSYDIWK